MTNPEGTDLERLRALAEKERDHWKHNHDHIKARIALLLDRPDLPQARKNIQQIMADRIEKAESALAQAIAERDRMVEALKPFLALHGRDDRPDETVITLHGYVTLGNFRRAQALTTRGG